MNQDKLLKYLSIPMAIIYPNLIISVAYESCLTPYIGLALFLVMVSAVVMLFNYKF